MIETKFINFGPQHKDQYGFYLNEMISILEKVKEYAARKDLEYVQVCEVEDCRWSDPRNKRFDVTILYLKRGYGDNAGMIRQKLLILNGELLDGEEFHKRYNEFYGKEEEA